MADRMPSLRELIDSLPADLQQEVYDFAMFLAKTRLPRSQRRARFNWHGDLIDLRDQFTSVDLQHDILSQWDSDVST